MSSKNLLTPVKLGELSLKNRFVVAPLTRVRADKNGVPTDMMIKYYALRAKFGLIISEASSTSPNSLTFGQSGNIYTAEQVEGWKKIVDAVHEQGGQICIQIWHGGRTTNSSQIEGRQPVAPSAIAINGLNRYTNTQYDVPHALTIPQIKEVVEEFRQGAINAKKAGFDAIQLHGANSYLVDEFLRDSANHRTDEYGGSIENRSRFALEVIDALISVFGAGRVSVRFSPTGRTNDMYDSNALGLMTYLLSELDKRNIAFVEFKRHSAYDVSINKEGQTPPDVQIPDFFKTLRKLYKGNLIGNDSITLKEAETLIEENTVDAVSYGHYSIFNPDLIERYTNDWPLDLNRDRTHFYQGGEKFYTDIPFYSETNQQIV